MALHGILVVDKPPGATSHDVVARIRTLSGSRVGHTGTLDPMATGVLVICIGSATRLSRFLVGGTKEYAGEIVVGIRTDTYDAEGRIVEERPLAGIDLEAIRRAAGTLKGEILQVPPPWSAKKVEGKRSYDLARAGSARRLAPCRVRVDAFEILSLAGNRVSFRVTCGGGTYVRSLAEDLGRLIGCGAHLAALRRVRNGAFSESEALGLPAVEAAHRAGNLAEILRPLETLELGLPAARLSETGESWAVQGRAIPASAYVLEGGVPHGMVRLLGASGRFIGVAEPGGEIPPSLRPCVILIR